MLEEADVDRSGGLDRQEFRNLIRKMRMMEHRELPAPSKALATPPQPSLVYNAGAAPVVPGVGPAMLHGQG